MQKITIERLEDGRTHLSYPEGISPNELAFGISVIYLHAKKQLEQISEGLGVNLIELAEQKIKEVT